MRILFIILFASFLVFNCTNKKKADTTVYIGAYRIIDQLVPYPFILKKNQDSVYLYNNNGDLIDKTFCSEIKKNETIKFRGKNFQILNTIVEGFYTLDLLDTLNFKQLKNGNLNPKNSAKFVKIQSTKNLDLELLKTNIKNTIWNYNVIENENYNPNRDLEIKQTFQFRGDSVTVLSTYYYQDLKTVSEYQIKKYNIFKVDNVCFLSFEKEENNPQPIYQIVDYKYGKIKLNDFSSQEVKNIVLYKDAISNEDYLRSVKQSSFYSNCFDGYQGEYYYGDDVTYNKGNDYLINYVNKNIPEKETKSGYIVIHFNINCKGKIGSFGLIQMDREYKKTLFSKELVNHVLIKVSALNDFPSTYSQINWLEYKDVHAFLMFKINNGKITDLCP